MLQKLKSSIFSRCFAVAVILTMTCTFNPTAQPTVDLSEKHNSAKTECLASNEELSSFHCLPAEPVRVPCVDAKVDECPQWKEKGECSKNPQYMLIHCRKSCQSCIGLHQGGVLQIAPSEETRAQVLQRLVETQEYQHWQAERSVASLNTCINKHELCTHWSLAGECEVNAHYMNRECPAACRTC